MAGCALPIGLPLLLLEREVPTIPLARPSPIPVIQNTRLAPRGQEDSMISSA